MMEESVESAERPQYASKLELLLTLVGYAVGFGNIWRFPYLTYSFGGGAFLVPYFIALILMGLPLFVLELGLGQMFRQGTLGIWNKLKLPRLRGVGAAATICTFFVSLYYNVILAWTLYYLGRTLGTLFSGRPLPWSDEAAGFSCPEMTVYPSLDVAGLVDIVDSRTGLFNPAYRSNFWCPETGLPTATSNVPGRFSQLTIRPKRCPAMAAVQFWEKQVLQQSSGMDDLGGFQPGMVLAFTVAWLLVYFCIRKGISSSGKVVYVTATLPYIILVVFFFRAVTLPNAGTGTSFYVKTDPSVLADSAVWLRAVTQIFYSLGVGFGSLIAFASYNKKESDYAGDAAKVCVINCSTSIFAGFVVFPILGFLCQEMSNVNPCIRADNIGDLSYIGLSGPGLAFIAFPIAISQMSGSYLWAILFFVMLLCLGIDSQFAMCESIVTVLQDAGVGKTVSKPIFTGVVCAVSYCLGLIFMTRGGIYWFQLFDYYSCVVCMFFVTLLECVGVMWARSESWQDFRDKTKECTGRELGHYFLISWKYVCPILLSVLVVLSFVKWDLMGAKKSVRYPEGSGYLPGWSIWLGWAMGVLPLLAFVVAYFLPVDEAKQKAIAESGEAKASGYGSF